MSASVSHYALVLDGLHKSYDGVAAVADVSLGIPKGSILALLGPSGCGKTTILRSIAGFVTLDKGQIRLDGRDITRLPPEQRGTAMVFQNYALFPHMNVAENAAFGLRMRKVGQAERDQRVAEVLAMVRLDELADRYPSELSGGQQQRAALARAIITRPDVLLLDEPFGALDQNLREAMQIELRKLQQQLNLTTVIVTHDQQEAMILADKVAVMRDGQVIQLATPADIYDRPATRFVAGFMGIDNILDARVDGGRIRIGGGTIGMPPVRRSLATGSAVTIAVRAEAIALGPAGPGDGVLQGLIAYAANLGGHALYEVDIATGERLKVSEPRAPGRPTRMAGEAVALRIDPQSCTILRD
jgi:ABC-type Fe3+/spermidine/putrescine transport system ATPase subunit